MKSSYVAVCLGAALLAHCVTNATGRQSLRLIPESQMDLLGAQAYGEIVEKERPMAPGKVVEDVTAIAKQVAAASGAAFEWEFRVFESDTVNAFCLPGGRIGIFSGLLPVAKTNAGLAAVIGHEIAHATLHHGNERLSQGLVLQLGLQASDVALGDARLRNPIMAALGIGVQVGAVLPFGRFQESEADVLGLRYMMKAGYDGAEAAALWERMGQAKSGAESPVWLSTHPASAERRASLESQARALRAEFAQTQETKDLKIESAQL